MAEPKGKKRNKERAQARNLNRVIRILDVGANHPYECDCSTCKAYWDLLPPRDETNTIVREKDSDNG